MIVSLEAIFLSTFVLISQNRLSDEAERRADLDLHIGLLTEHELTRVLKMLDAISTSWGSRTRTTASSPTWKWRRGPRTCSPRSSACSAARPRCSRRSNFTRTQGP